MKVRELIEMLEEMDPDAEVYTMAQPAWPFEHMVHGVCKRSDFCEPLEPGEGEERPARHCDDRWVASEEDLPGSDVFIVEGSQTRYGNKGAWDACNR